MLIPTTLIQTNGGKIFDSTLTIDAATIDTGAILPPQFDVLEVWIIARTSEAAVVSTFNVVVNNDTGANYDSQFVRGTAATASAAESFGNANWGEACPGDTAQAGSAGTTRFTIPGYAQTTFHKTAEWVSASPEDSTGQERITVRSHRWRNTAAITRLAVNAGSGVLRAGSRLLIYGR